MIIHVLNSLEEIQKSMFVCICHLSTLKWYSYRVHILWNAVGHWARYKWRHNCNVPLWIHIMMVHMWLHNGICPLHCPTMHTHKTWILVLDFLLYRRHFCVMFCFHEIVITTVVSLRENTDLMSGSFKHIRPRPSWLVLKSLSHRAVLSQHTLQ